DVTSIASGATEGVNPEASAALGWVSMATGIAGMGGGVALAPKGVRALKRARAQPDTELDISPPPYDTGRLSIPVHDLNSNPQRMALLNSEQHRPYVVNYFNEFVHSATRRGDTQLAQTLNRDIHLIYENFERLGGLNYRAYRRAMKVRIGSPESYSEIMLPKLRAEAINRLDIQTRHLYRRATSVMELLNKDNAIVWGAAPPDYTFRTNHPFLSGGVEDTFV
ncbi:hypothetical protein ACLETS_24570, partial [Enterobacter ludwigii]